MLCLCFIQRGLSKNVSHHGWSTTKNVKITLAKTIYSKLNEWLKISYFEFSFRFSSRKSQNQQKLAKKINYLKIQFRSKNLTYFMNFSSLKIVKIIPLQHSQKPYSLNFSSKNKNKKQQQLKKTHCTLSRRPRTAFSKHLESKRPDISDLCKKFYVPET